MLYEVRPRKIAEVIRDDNCSCSNCGFNEFVIRFIEKIRSPTKMELRLVRKRNELEDQIGTLFGCKSRQFPYGRSHQNIFVLSYDSFGKHQRNSTVQDSHQQ